MASSSSNQERTISCPKLYDAFISHRGPDVKDTLAKQLYDLLKARECRAFLDREEIEGGDSIPAAIRNGISSSAVQIAIFSKGYAQSSWCLDELVFMLEQIDKGAMFIPVFYNVKPWELRYMENDNSQYAAALSYYQSKSRNLDRLDTWKKALESAANISGYEHSQPQGDSRDLCEKVVSRVMQEMQKRIPLHVAKYPIALDELVQDFEKSCPQTAGLVGVFGLGGSGKTTLAKELFNRKRDRYTVSCFLPDVRESHANRQLHSLQNQLSNDLFHKESKFRNVDEGIAGLKYRLERGKECKFLIVLDDVDSQDQLDALLPGLEVEGMLISSGSLVIITTRDQSVLTAADVSISYNMKVLDRKHSKKLFCSHALRPRDSPTAYEYLVECFVDFCDGLPLSLIVLGAHVRGRGEQFWKLELEKVKKIPPQEIMQRLKISFDGLDKEEKQIFIDIACFFNKQEFIDMRQRDFYVETSLILDPSTLVINASQKEISYGEIEPMLMWKMSGWNAEHAVQTLQQKCLLQVVRSRYHWRFEMHDHLRDLGRQMADEFGPPRLWRPNILRSMEAKGFKHILDNTKARCFNSFEDSSLRTKIIYFTGTLNDSGKLELLWLAISGDGGSIEEIPSWIPLQKLHYLFVKNMEVWNSFQQQMHTDSQADFELRRLHIHGLYSLQKFPELGKLERLNTLELQECLNLETIPVLSSLKELRSLHVKDCYILKTISDLSSLTGLQSLYVRQCYRLRTMSGISSLTALQSLRVQRCLDLETVFSLSSLTELRSLHMQGYLSIDCFKCEIMLSEELNVANMRNLERIEILGCCELQRVQGFEELQRLKILAIEVPEDGYSWVRNCVHALRRLPSEYAILIGNAVEKAVSRLNVELFSQVVSGATIHEIDRKADTVHMSSSSSAITIYALVGVCGEIKVSAELETPYRYKFKLAGGHVMFTVVLPPRSQFEFMLDCREGCSEGRVGKGFKATVNVGEEGKALSLLQSIVDKLYGESTVHKLGAYDAKRKRK